MVMFWPIQQELNCISDSGRILGKIRFDVFKDEFIFCPDNESIVLSDLESSHIDERLSGLESGKYSIPMQDDDWFMSGAKEALELQANFGDLGALP